MKKIIFITFACLVVLSTVSAGGVKEVDITKEPFFPIVGFDFLWRINERIVKEQAEMGLTLITINSIEELDWCEKYDIKGIVYQPKLDRFLKTPDSAELENEIITTVDNLKNHKAFYAMQYTDEPSKGVIAGYRKVYSALKKAAPNTPVYTNLFPSWSMPYQHGFENYEEYITAFCEIYSQYQTPLLVYDNYRNKDTRISPPERLASFLENLDTVRRITQKYNIPFWVTVLGSAHDHFPDPTAADLDFEVFSSLAYGAKGIGYFTTISHQNGLFQGGPFNWLGDKTPLYYTMKELNYRIKKLAPILNNLQSTGCYYSLTPKDKMTFKKYPMFQSLPGRLTDSITSDRDNCSFLVGEFKDDKNEDWVIVVNLNMTEVANFTATLKNGKKMQHFNSYMGYLYPVTVQDPWLRPGQGKLYKVVH